MDDVRTLVAERTLVHDLKAGPGGTARDARVLEETFRLVCRYAGQAMPASTIGEGVREVLRSGVSDKTIHDALRFLAHADPFYASEGFWRGFESNPVDEAQVVTLEEMARNYQAARCPTAGTASPRRH